MERMKSLIKQLKSSGINNSEKAILD